RMAGMSAAAPVEAWLSLMPSSRAIDWRPPVRASISVMFIFRVTSWGDRSEDAAGTSTGASERTGGVRIIVRSDSDEQTLCPTTHEPGLTPRGRTSPMVYRDRAELHASAPYTLARPRSSGPRRMPVLSPARSSPLLAIDPLAPMLLFVVPIALGA